MYRVTTNSKPIRGEENRRKESLFSWPRLQYDLPEVLTGHYVTVAYVQVLVIPWDKCGVILRTHVWVLDRSLFLALFSLSQSLPHSDPHPPSSSFLTTQSFMCLSLGVPKYMMEVYFALEPNHVVQRLSLCLINGRPYY